MLKHNNSLDLATPIYRALIVLYNIGNREEIIDKQPISKVNSYLVQNRYLEERIEIRSEGLEIGFLINPITNATFYLSSKHIRSI